MNSILVEITDFLQRPLPTDEKKVQVALNDLSKIRLALIVYKKDCQMSVLLLRAKYRRPAEKGLTDFDRRILLNEMIAEEESSHQQACDLYELLQDKHADLIAIYSP